MIGRLGLIACALLLTPFAYLACTNRGTVSPQTMNLGAAHGVLLYVRSNEWPLARVKVTDQHGCVEYSLGNGRVWIESQEPLTLTFERSGYARGRGMFFPGKWYIVEMRSELRAN